MAEIKKINKFWQLEISPYPKHKDRYNIDLVHKKKKQRIEMARFAKRDAIEVAERRARQANLQDLV